MSKLYLVGIETAPLPMLTGDELAPASEALMDALTATGWAKDVVTGGAEGTLVLRARFFVEATTDNPAEVMSSAMIFEFLHAVAEAIHRAVPPGRVLDGTVISGGELLVEPTTVAKFEVEVAPAA